MANPDATRQALGQFDSLPDSSVVRLPVVMALFGVSRTTVWRSSKSGHLPKPTRFTPGAAVWNVGELRRVLNKGARAA